MPEYAIWRPVEKLSPIDKVAEILSRSGFHGTAALMALYLSFTFVLIHPDSSKWERIVGLLVVMGLSAVIVRLSNPSLPTARLKKVLDKFEGSFHAVRLTIWKDGEVLGHDEGVVRFEQGMLLYSGVQTDFALGTGDVFVADEVPLIRDKDARFKHRGGGGDTWGFRLADDPSVQLAFFPYIVARSTTITTPLRAWLESDERAEGVRVLPPNTPLDPAGALRGR